MHVHSNMKSTYLCFASQSLLQSKTSAERQQKSPGCDSSTMFEKTIVHICSEIYIVDAPIVCKMCEKTLLHICTGMYVYIMDKPIVHIAVTMSSETDS